ncbi:hypothetical protein I7I51_06849, partial [Histoplasma capsulatum]
MAPDVQSDSPQARQISDKKRPKWSPEEDVLIIELRQRGMAWGDISKELPGRSALSCRLHYQNYLERRKQADPSRKCGRKLQRRCPSPGGPLKLCTGNWENKKWRDDLGQFRSHSLNPHQNAHVPFSSLPLRNSTPYPKGTAATQLLSQRWVILRRGIGRGWRDYRRRGFIPIIAVQLGFDTAAFDMIFASRMELEFFVTSQANPPETLSHRESRELCKTIELIYARLIIAEDIISALEAGHYLDEAFGGRICSLRDIKRRLRPYQQHDRHESRPHLHKCPAARCQHQFETADNLPRHIRNTADLSHRFDKEILDGRYCFQCGKEFASAKSLWLHEKNDHLESSRSRIDAFRQLRRASQHPTCCPSRKRKLGDCERGATSGNLRDQRQKRSDLSRTPSSGNTVHSARKQNQQRVPEEQRPDPQPVVEGTAADKVGELPFHAVMQPSSTGSEISAFDYSVNSVADPSSIHSSYIGPSGSIFDYSVDSMADPSSIHSSYIG